MATSFYFKPPICAVSLPNAFPQTSPPCRLASQLHKKPEREPSEKSPKWSTRSIKSFAMAELEARNIKYPNTRTESLLMGIRVVGTSQAAKFFRANGITLSSAGESGEITTTYLLLGIWSEKESAGHKILAILGFNDEKAKDLAKYIKEDIVSNYK